MVGVIDRFQSVVATAGENFNQRFLVSSQSFHRLFQFETIQFDRIHDQPFEQFGEISRCLRFQISAQILDEACHVARTERARRWMTYATEFTLERRFDLHSLLGRSIAQDVDEGLFVRAESFHRLSQFFSITVGIEIRRGSHGALLLKHTYDEQRWRTARSDVQ